MPPADQLAYFTCLLLSFPLSQFYWKYLLSTVGSIIKKQLFFAVFGHVFLFILFLPNYHHSKQNDAHPLRWLWHIYGPTLFSYGWCWLMRGKRWMPYINFTVLLGFSTYLHWCRYQWQYGEYRLDHITVIMLLVIKFSSFGFDINDAYRQKYPIHGKKRVAAEEEKLDPRLEPLKDNYYPNFLEFCAYSFLYAGVLTGPVVFYPEFKSFLDGTFFNFPHAANLETKTQTHAVIVLDHATLSARRKRIRSLFFKAFVFILFHFALADKAQVSFLISQDFANTPWYRKILLLHLFNFTWRTKYYIAWLLAECSHVVLGLGYRCSLHTNSHTNITTVHHSWDGLEVVDPIKVEGAHTFRHTLTEWHKTTNIWLYRYVYMRCGFLNNAKRGKPGFRANLFTKFISALWHGIYPGYYVTFGTAAFYTWASQLAYRNLSWPAFVPTGIKYWFALIINHALSDYVIATFEIWPLRDCFKFYKAYSYLGHIVIFGGIILIKFVIQPIKAKQHLQ